MPLPSLAYTQHMPNTSLCCIPNQEGHNKVVKFLREHGGELKWDEGKESSELCELAKVGDLERVKLLLDCGCSANAADYDKRTCLHLACSVGNLRVITALIDHGVDINFKDRWGGTGLADAIREGHRDVAVPLADRIGEASPAPPVLEIDVNPVIDQGGDNAQIAHAAREVEARAPAGT